MTEDTTQGATDEAGPEYTITETSTERPDGTVDEADAAELTRYRTLLGQSLRVFRKAVENCRKAEETVGNDTRETDNKLQQTDHLIGLLDDQRGLDLGMNGTPIGDALTNGGELPAGGDDEVDEGFGRTPRDRAKPKGKGRGKRGGKSKRGAR